MEQNQKQPQKNRQNPGGQKPGEKPGKPQTAPDMPLPATGGKTVNLRDFKGKNVILYFYPKDDTPGCAQEGKDFSAAYEEIKKLNGEVFGVSRDSIASHEKFKAKYKYKFDLISDSGGALCRAFDVIREKVIYGKKRLGIERSSFVIDSGGKIAREWRKVNVEGHAKDILSFLKTLQK